MAAELVMNNTIATKIATMSNVVRTFGRIPPATFSDRSSLVSVCMVIAAPLVTAADPYATEVPRVTLRHQTQLRRAPDGGTGGMESAHAVHAAAWRSGRRAEVDTRDPGPVRVGREPRPDHRLPWRVRPGEDVAADEVRVVGRPLGRRCGPLRHDAVTEAWREPLDLGQDQRPGVRVIPGRDVTVSPDRVRIAA